MIIRPEREADYPAITKLTRLAFAGTEHGLQNEDQIILVLRSTKAMTLSLVAEEAGEIVGHVAFSKVLIDGKFCDYYGLGPISVDPKVQNKGIGSKLILESFAPLKKLGAKAIVLVGYPEYYNRFGFKQTQGITVTDVPDEVVLVLTFADQAKPEVFGLVSFDPAFYCAASDL